VTVPIVQHQAGEHQAATARAKVMRYRFLRDARAYIHERQHDTTVGARAPGVQTLYLASESILLACGEQEQLFNFMARHLVVHT
jgi:hypothetical protein